MLFDNTTDSLYNEGLFEEENPVEKQSPLNLVRTNDGFRVGSIQPSMDATESYMGAVGPVEWTVVSTADFGNLRRLGIDI